VSTTRRTLVFDRDQSRAASARKRRLNGAVKSVNSTPAAPSPAARAIARPTTSEDEPTIARMTRSGTLARSGPSLRARASYPVPARRRRRGGLERTATVSSGTTRSLGTRAGTRSSTGGRSGASGSRTRGRPSASGRGSGRSDRSSRRLGQAAGPSRAISRSPGRAWRTRRAAGRTPRTAIARPRTDRDRSPPRCPRARLQPRRGSSRDGIARGRTSSCRTATAARRRSGEVRSYATSQ